MSRLAHCSTSRLTRCPLRHPVSGANFQRLLRIFEAVASIRVGETAAYPRARDTEMKQNSGSIVTERKSDSLLMESGAAWENDVLLYQLLAMAQGFRDGGDVRTAMDLYWLLAEEHQETLQAVTAKQVLLEMAAGYERRRAPHMARSIYARLLP